MATNILFRRTINPTVPSATTVKGAPLTSSEIDGNFKSVKDAIDDILLNGIGSVLARHSVTATAGQTVFDLPFVYSPGTNNLLVFVIGSLVERNVDYTETTTQRVTFNSGLEEGQEVTFLTNISPSPGLTYAAAGVSSYYLATDGVQTSFTLPVSVLSKNNTQIFNNGIYQAKDGYAIAGTTLLFDEAPTAGHIEINVIAAMAIGQTTADLVEYTPAGTGAVATTVQSKLRESVSVKDFGAVGDGVANDTTALITAQVVSATAGLTLEIPDGIYHTTAGFDFSGIGKSHWRGSGFAQIKFINSTANAVLLRLGPNSSYQTFENVRFIDATPGTSCAIEIKDSRSPDVVANWKNSFLRCRFDQFAIGVFFNAAGDYLNKSTENQDFCSETMFFQCKFKNCRISVLNRNTQAVNNTFVGTDIENDNVGEQYEMIRDECGGEIKFFGGSLIGHGAVYTWKHPTGANTWTLGSVKFFGPRVEVRGDPTYPHAGAIFRQDPTGVTTGTSNASIEFTGDLIGVGSSISVDLIRYAGKVSANFNLTNAANFSILLVRNFPVNGISSSSTSGAIGEVCVNSPNGVVKHVIDTAATYGTTDTRFPAKVTITGGKSTGGSSSADSLGFISVRPPGFSNLAFGLQPAVVHRITYQDPNVTAGWKTVKAVLPLNVRPLRFTFFKHPVRWASNFVVRLYAVKDSASWVNPLSFDVATDTIAVIATITTGANSAGAFTTDIRPVSNSFGNSFMPGVSTLWTEGRIYVESDQTTSTSFIGGSFTIEYS